MASSSFTTVFHRTREAVMKRPRYVSSRGGTRSGKTFAILQILDLLVGAHDKPGDITSVVSESLPHLKRGAIRDYERIIGHSLRDDPRWNESEHCYTYPNGGKLEFFSADAPGKVHGPARKRLFLNECNHIDYETARQLFVRTSGVIFMDYNPAAMFWGIEKVEERENCITIKSTYKDNEFLSDEQVREIESNRTDEGWWKVYGEGELGQLDGLIFTKFMVCDAMPEKTDGMKEAYGWDFGFTNDVSCLMHVYIDTRKREIWAEELCFRKGMLNEDMAAVMKENKVSRTVPVYGDAAEPKTLADLHRYGYNMLPCHKATRKAEQLQMMKGYTLHITKRSLNCIREGRGYVWLKDKDGNLLNEPTQIQDHSMDALRYCTIPYLLTPSNQTTRISRT